MTEQTTIPDSPQPLDLSTALEKVTQEIAVFDRLNAGIAQLEAAHPSNLVIDVTTPAGMKEAIKARAAWRDPRVSVEKARKVAKAPILALGRQLDTFAESIEKRLRVGEDNYNAQIKVETERQEAIKAEAKAREEARIQAIRDRIAMRFTSRPGAMFGASAADLDAAIRAVVAEPMTEEVFFELLPEAQAAQDRALVALRDMHDKQSDRERAEAEQKRIAEENARQAAKLADERAEFEKLQAQAKREQEERERQEREAREAREAEIRAREEAIRAEQKRLDDARRAEEDAKAAAERERLDKEAAQRRERTDRIAAIRHMPRDFGGSEKEIAEALQLIGQISNNSYWGDLAPEAETALNEAAEGLKKRRTELNAKREAQEKADREAAALAKAQRKLAAAQKAGPRTLAALKELLRQVEQADTLEGGDIKAYEAAKKEARAAIAEGDAA